MTIDEINDEWTKDCNIDRTELGEESLKIPQLHNKYLKIYSSERLKLLKMESDMKILKKDKYEFFTQGPNEYTPSDWKLPPKGMILKSDIPMYMESDQGVINMNLKIGYQKEKIDLLEEILKSINNRGYSIRAAIDWHKFTMGG
jgi:hypothetical protein